MTIGELLRQTLEWLYAFWPLRIVHDWEQGVLCRLGQATQRLTSRNGWFDTGLHTFWPGVEEIIVAETNIEVVETELQTVATWDDTAATFSLGLKYRISNLKAMYQNIHDARETIYNELCSVAGWCAAQIEYNAIHEQLCDQIILETKEQMGEWGIEIVSVQLINLSKAQTVRVITNRGLSPSDLD